MESKLFKIAKPHCIWHYMDEPFCGHELGGECTDPYYTGCPMFSEIPYECTECSHPYCHDSIPEVCSECFHEINEADIALYGLVEI